MLHGNPAVLESGIPLSHARTFSEVARTQQCIITCRSVGKYATGLIQENYATKGFHVKAKSSNWGPMAGLVLVDCRFSKNGPVPGKAQDQQKLINKAFDSGAGKRGVFISQVRRAQLIQLFAGDPSTSYAEYRIAHDEILIVASKAGHVMHFILKLQNVHAIAGASEPMWALCYRYTHQLPGPSALGGKITTSYGELYQLMALTDPRGDAATAATYRGALTGDYDLWGCFPKQENYDPQGIDERRVKHSANQLVSFGTFDAWEDEHQGNMTARLCVVRNQLNSGFQNSGYTGGNIVHHSDEAGRPMVDNIEVEAVAFFPGGKVMYFNTVAEYKQFIDMARAGGFKTILNAWWKLFKEMDDARIRQLVSSRNNHIKVIADIKMLGMH